MDGETERERLEEESTAAREGSRPEGIGLDHAALVTKWVRPVRGGALRRDDARNLLRRTIERYVETHDLSIYAWAFLPSRVMLLVDIPTRLPLVEVLSDVFGYYTRRFNARYHKEGALFRTKFLKDVLLGPDEIGRAIRRIHASVKGADLAAKPGDEPWSSGPAYAGMPDRITTIYVPKPALVRPASGPETIEETTEETTAAA